MTVTELKALLCDELLKLNAVNVSIQSLMQAIQAEQQKAGEAALKKPEEQDYEI